MQRYKVVVVCCTADETDVHTIRVNGWGESEAEYNAYKFQGCAQIYRNYLPQHIAIHVRKQYLAELNRKRKGGRNAQGDSH